jgi:hypothetical protein
LVVVDEVVGVPPVIVVTGQYERAVVGLPPKNAPTLGTPTATSVVGCKDVVWYQPVNAE